MNSSVCGSSQHERVTYTHTRREHPTSNTLRWRSFIIFNLGHPSDVPQHVPHIVQLYSFLLDKSYV